MNRHFKIFLGILLASGCMRGEALEIVYPKQSTMKTAAESIFFLGNANKNAKLALNGNSVKVWENGSFVQVVALHNGKNRIVLEESCEGLNSKIEYDIERVNKESLVETEAVLECFDDEAYNYATIVNDNTPLRALPNEGAKRLTHLNKGTIIPLKGKKGGYYLVSLSPSEEAWIKDSNVVSYMSIKEPVFAAISDIKVSDDKLFDYIKISMDMPMPYKIDEVDGGLNFKIYGVHKNCADNKLINSINNIKNVAITTSSEKVTTLFIELNSKLWGYDCYYEGNDLIIKIRKEPKVNTNKPLKDVTIAVDAGHGGKDCGAVGPTKAKESDVNLDIAKKLKKELEEAGANVVMTREDDSYVELYDRPLKAKENNALIMVSLHANALPNGCDPYKKHGTAVFYYNDESKELADIIKNTLMKDLGTKDDGTSKASFVLTRPSMPLSVLVEVAYMIHPVEYSMLIDETFRQKAAESIKKALEEYVLGSVSK